MQVTIEDVTYPVHQHTLFDLDDGDVIIRYGEVITLSHLDDEEDVYICRSSFGDVYRLKNEQVYVVDTENGVDA